MEQVILVDSRDRERGSMEKMQAHREGKLHRAFSIFIFNKQGEMLLQRRAADKYHSGGLWTNACCGHPRPGEDTAQAASRRLMEEVGLTAGPEKLFSFVYMTPVGNELFEYEYDHVFKAVAEGEPKANPEEVDEWKWVPTAEISADLDANPLKYTIWFQLIFKEVKALSEV
jgi:isopentenyl-diphosphate Delta-isomerase